MRTTTRLIALTASLGLVAAIAGCASTDDAAGAPTDIETALEEGGTLTFWSWATASQAKADAFTAKYPNVTIEYVNAGSGLDQYAKIENALKAGSGAPDVAQFEYTAMPQFALGGDLADLTAFGFDELESEFAAGPWSSVQYGDAVYALPEDSGPMALFYNARVFEQFGIAVPTTWDEYVTAAETLHAADSNYYLTSDGGDGLFVSSMTWQAGGHPYQVDGEDITIDLQDEGSRKWTAVWNQLLENGLLSPTPSWTDDWYKQLGNGEIASLVSGAWMPGLLESAAPEAAGDWRVAPMPTYDGGDPVSANFGGSAMAVLESSENKALAAAFVEFMNADAEGVALLVENGAFPSTIEALTSPSLIDVENAYFGGQKVNEVLLAASEAVPSGWQYLPYQSYAQSIFGDTAGQAYANQTDLNDGLKAWQDALVTYGNQQGFTVNGG
ncbi:MULTISPECIES: sugar ABC transporter substrate-binding protein [unclassified Microbacterium]|uniref:ABC transporter substrate-binding protein n=1 Tax=unclassified Microbacterium TaxID=2609290 RepID=UPI00214CEF05|nr:MULTISPECIES: sugar ABC transporter substrate-binding protein [unclassified Microbacterium]MCR2784805.1 sugar ABC transporter substrate-binding protein [Microbacterium sp. zg.B96]MDL5352743.1 sugar ABC transporter substrate-binding protein [Microbacterium sp. zg-YB36]WIM16344.1 sugar ABC transporter substrate-binding protein [Microbacterium sp. zg-B96]